MSFLSAHAGRKCIEPIGRNRFGGSNDLPYITFRPTYAATSGYHKASPADLQSQPMESVVKQAEEFANGRYAAGLLKGTTLPPDEFRAVAELLSRYTGLSNSFVTKAKLRIDQDRFGKELLRSTSRTVGRFSRLYEGRCFALPCISQSLQKRI